MWDPIKYSYFQYRGDHINYLSFMTTNIERKIYFDSTKINQTQITIDKDKNDEWV